MTYVQQNLMCLPIWSEINATCSFGIASQKVFKTANINVHFDREAQKSRFFPNARKKVQEKNNICQLYREKKTEKKSTFPFIEPSLSLDNWLIFTLLQSPKASWSVQ